MLKRIIKTVTVVVTIACLVVCFFPVQAFADPVSATIIANAFAQAIAAYGAANGVSMTFDVVSSSSIGESVHELWKDFREGTQDADDYATLAAALFPDLYYKAATAVGTGSDIFTVGYNISSEYAEEFDNFYNWLLSGPAEMVQVDNQYYQFSQAQIGSNATPISLYNVSYYKIGELNVATVPYSFYGRSNFNCTVTTSGNNNHPSDFSTTYAFWLNYGNKYYLCCASPASTGGLCYNWYRSDYRAADSFMTSSELHKGIYWGVHYGNNYYGTPYTLPPAVYQVSQEPTSSNIYNLIDEVFGLSDVTDTSISTSTSGVGVKAYDNTGIADIPDTADPNYDALNRAREIPTDIPWDDTAYGDGSGTLTDAQTEAIASDVDLTLVEDGVIELVEEGVEPAPTPNEVVIPFLPVGLPSFNFSFSGIWHYVREWVTSLGAWLATLFLIWSALPYAMVVPVYATAVVVIVLGVYKRFFM